MPDTLTPAYLASSANLSRQTAAYARSLWVNSPNYYDADIDTMVAHLTPVVQAGQMQQAYLANAYSSQYANANGVAWRSTPVDYDSIINYRGIAPDVVYRRPAVQTYTALSRGVDYDAAIAQGLSRLLSIVLTDLEQSANRQAQAALDNSGFEYFERVLTGAENCAFCVIASTQVYHRGNLLPMHPGCDCKTRGLKSNRNPGNVVDPDLLESTHQAIIQKFGGTDYGARDLGLGKFSQSNLSDFTDLIVTNTHGELGPVLGWRGDNFTGPSDLH
ncbi:MAG TPA: hypothetical protein VGM94_04930 [Galbitalea sp.]|jgi:hypothetical protein